MTPKEFGLATEAYNMRQEASLQLTAIHASWILSPWSKKRITPKMLLGRPGPEFVKPVFSDREAFVKHMREKKRKAELKSG